MSEMMSGAVQVGGLIVDVMCCTRRRLGISCL